MDLIDIMANCSGNTPGIGVEVLFAPRDYFTTIAKPVSLATATTNDQIVNIVDNHVFDANKGFHKIMIDSNTGEVLSKAVGPDSAKSFEHSFEGFVLNNDKLNTGLLSRLASCNWVFLIPENTSNGIVYRQIGSQMNPAKCQQNDYASGKTSSDNRGTTLLFKSERNITHVPFYSGTIVMHP